jgi:hypothetical protein
MSEIVCRVFVVGVLLFYAGLVMVFLLWKLRRWFGGSGKKRVWPTLLEHFSALRFFTRPYDAR